MTDDIEGNPIIISAYSVFVGDVPDFECSIDAYIASVSEPYLELEGVVEYAERLFFKVIAESGSIRSRHTPLKRK